MPEETAALAKKLRLTPETRLLALNAPDAYVEALRQAGVAVSLAPVEEGDTYDAVHSFIRTQAEVEAALTSAVAALADLLTETPDGRPALRVAGRTMPIPPPPAR